MFQIHSREHAYKVDRWKLGGHAEQTDFSFYRSSTQLSDFQFPVMKWEIELNT